MTDDAKAAAEDHYYAGIDFFGDGRIVDRGILEAVAEGFVIEGDATVCGNFGAGEEVPVVDEIVFHGEIYFDTLAR